MNNIVWIILDSCRFDSFVAAKVKNFTKIAKVEKRYSYASWTSPSHYTFLMGMIPHVSPSGVFASDVYREEFKLWNQRIGIDNLSFKDFVPELNLVKRLNDLGYRSIGRVSLPVLNQSTTMSTHFHNYKLMDDHNDFKGMVEEMDFLKDTPTFYFLNIGETHYPYMLTDQDLPHISGVHGVFKHLDDFIIHRGDEGKYNAGNFFTHPEMQRLKNQQVKAVEYCDMLFNELLSKCPSNTYFIITADHGELFGEKGYFGHGPIMHEKVFEIPFIEGKKKKKSLKNLL
jgi:membrane-anchored protein YejM (alkaline phosphatase superfamily)